MNSITETIRVWRLCNSEALAKRPLVEVEAKT
jgi:hypothetical protein